MVPLNGALVLACALILALPWVAPAVHAQTPAPAVPKPSAQLKPAKAIKGSSSPHQDIRGFASQMAAGVAAAEAALTDVELEIASRVHTGLLPCELGASVSIRADERAPGYFDVVIRGQRLRMFPVASATGAVRLEDRRLGAVWLQLANKSMLMNQRLGQRMADECKSPAQAAVAEALRLNPPPSILDAPSLAPAPTTSAPAASPGLTPPAVAAAPLTPASAP